MLIPAISR